MSTDHAVSGARQPVWLFAAAVATLGALGAGVLFFPTAASAALLVSGYFYLTLALGAVVFLAMMYVSKAGWHTALKRVVEAIAAYLPVAALTMLIALATLQGLEHRPPQSHVAAYLERSFLMARAAAVLAVWIVLGALLRRNSLSQDSDADVRHTQRNVTLSAVFLVLFPFTFSLANIDWLMSLEEHWSSTIFGLYQIGGLLSGSVASISIAVIWLRRQGHLTETNEDHLHDLGKLLFGFVTLWAYLWYSQYLLIWYTNFPEETGFYLTRTAANQGLLFWANIVVNWLVPFVLLLPRDAKRSEKNLFGVSAIVLAGRWLDTHLMVAPAIGSSPLATMALEAVALVGLGALFVLVVRRALARAPLLAKGDPYLVEVVRT